MPALKRVKPLQRIASHARFRARMHQIRAQAQRTTAPAQSHGRAAPRVLICGWYGTETLGDKAILGGILDALAAIYPDMQCTLASLHPYISIETRHQMPELAGVDIVPVSAAITLAPQMDIVIFGGGPIMAVDQLADMQLILQQARKHNVLTVLGGCGVGPLGTGIHKRAIADILKLADMRIYRDKESLKVAGDLGAASHDDRVAEDPAFTWLHNVRPRSPVERIRAEKVLLLGLREFPWQEYASHLSGSAAESMQRAYGQAVAACLGQLARRFDSLVIRPLPMCTNHFGGDDRWFYRKLFRENSMQLPAIDMSLLNAELAPSAYAAAFLDADACIAMRYHSLVFALALGVPAVALDYTLGRGKVASLARKWDVPVSSIDSVSADFLANEVERLLVSRKAPQLPAPTFSTVLAQCLEARLIRRAG
jgi:polysaccharide pyruvyl transferase WcaK-like protein